MGHKYLAFDLGASGGRGLVGSVDGGKLRLSEVHRFSNGPVFVNGVAYWDAFRLLEEIKQGIRLAVREYGTEIAGIGIDTWGVDFALVGSEGLLVEMPRHYRDARNDGMLEAGDAVMSREEIYARTGIQFLQINTLYQLLAVSRQNPWALDSAHRLLMMPDLFNYWLTGVMANEFTAATTTQLYDPVNNCWAVDMAEKFGIPGRILGEIVRPGSVVGKLSAGVMEETRAHAIPVIAVASHDTASAVAAVPYTDPDSAYISSGTWSLPGIETEKPIINDEALRCNFTNEGGVGGYRFLCNVMGLWLVQECRRVWAEEGKDYTWDELVRRAEASEPLACLVDPDHESFLKPGDMPRRIRDYCRDTGQPVPVDDGSVVRTALESLATRYNTVMQQMEALRGRRIPQIHIVGGGVRNTLLCQLTAQVTGRPVVAGPVEATAIGNVLVQAMALGAIGSLEEGRAMVRDSFELVRYE